MPTLRFIFVMAALVLGTYELAHAQTTRPGGEQLPPGLQKMQEAVAKLDLTDDQKKQVQSLKDEIGERVRSLAPQLKDASQDERREKIRAELGDVRQKFMSILTPEQKQQLRENAEGSRKPPGHNPMADLKSADKADKAEAKAEKAETATTKKSDADTPMIGRLREVLDGLGLTPEQKEKTDAILSDAHDQIVKLRADAGGDRQAMRGKAQELLGSIRQKLAEVLTPDQQAKLKEQAPGRGGGRALDGGGGGRRNANKAGAGKTPATKPADAATQTPNTAAAKAAGVSSPSSASSAATSQPARLVAGSQITPFTLKRLNGSTVNSKAMAGKPLVVVFGSLTSPAFRDRLPQLEQMQNRYRSRSNLLIIYTREAHPSDGWQVERNRDDKLEIKSPTTFEERVSLAKQLHDRTKSGLDFAIDGMDDAVTKSFGDTIEGATVISPYGTVVGMQTYADPSGLPRLIDLALKSKD